MNRLLPIIVVAGGLLFGMTGCTSGPPTYRVKGKAVDGDKAILPDDNSSTIVYFVEQVEAGKLANTYEAGLNKDEGTFEMRGRDSAGIPAGKYLVKFRSTSLTPSATSKLLMEKFSTNSSPILIDIVDDKTPLVVDIGPYKSK